jgi:3-deoxy-D-manno-octulosonate 8-phosphate phosphatase (KDO 8-P phosphatase)
VNANPSSSEPGTLAQRARVIDFLVLDVDGVLTDGGIVYGCGRADDWVEIKRFHVRDGSGLKLWRRAGKRSAIITGRKSSIVDVRAAELDVETVIQGASDKTSAFEQVLKEQNLKPEAVCVMGDDVPDLGPLARAGLAVAVADACPDVRELAHYTTTQPGGRGAVREVIELILRCQGIWAGRIDPR